ncbi:MAG: hypothetical protein PUP92_39570 [Rhizonema sp. PD38]|nr:hypothetical protein [Rhizonema sp. PD38]
MRLSLLVSLVISLTALAHPSIAKPSKTLRFWDQKTTKLAAVQQIAWNNSPLSLSLRGRLDQHFTYLCPPNGTTPKMTATLWDMDERDAEETLQYLRSQALLLSGVSLADETQTYRLHDLFHDLARNLLTTPQKPKRQGDLVGLGIKLENAHTQLVERYQQQTENNLWHTLPDDGYIHQHLVWHLEKAGKVEEIHQLLREESASGNNGWYEVRERFGQIAGYLTDVASALELAETDWEKKNISQVVGLQCRYVLIIASLNSLAANIPTELIVVLVKNKFWYPEQGLAYALQKQDLESKANSLIALADYLPEALKQQALQKALEAARQIQDGRYRAEILSALAAKFSENLYPEALEAARQIQNEKYRLQVLSVLSTVILIKRPLNKIFSQWQEILKLLYTLKRKDFYQEMLNLVSVLFKLGGKEALTELETAIQDVGRWWR